MDGFQMKRTWLVTPYIVDSGLMAWPLSSSVLHS